VYLLGSESLGVIYYALQYQYMNGSSGVSFDVWWASTSNYQWNYLHDDFDFHLLHIGLSTDGTLMAANDTHLIYYTSTHTIRTTVLYNRTGSTDLSHIVNSEGQGVGFIQSPTTSIIYIPVPARGPNGLLAVNPDGTNLRRVGFGLLNPSSNTMGQILDLTFGPDNKIFLVNGNHLALLDPVSDYLQVVPTQYDTEPSYGGHGGYSHVYYHSGSGRLYVGSAFNGVNQTVLVYTLRPKP